MIAYFDCFSGISGDMILGALVDAGLSFQKLKKSLSALPIKGYTLHVKKVKRSGFIATKVDVEIRQGSGVRGQRSAKKWKDIEKIIKASTLSKDIKQKGLSIFRRLFEAEAKVHGEQFEKLHLHELGAVDCIVDIFGALTGLDALGIKKVFASSLNLGGGTVQTGHGTLPVPAPATAELLRGVPVYSTDVHSVSPGDLLGRELTTPTGAVIISSLAEGFGSMPDMEISRIGLGAGNKDFKGRPNVLRVFIGPKSEDRRQRADNPPVSPLNLRGDERKVTVIETNIDDMNPQIYEYVMEKLFNSDALDVFLTQVIMKKGRPGIKLTVLCSEDKRDALIKIILKETTSIGVRFYETRREILQRTTHFVDTRFGKIRVKISGLGTETVKITPEYEDCKKTAKKHGIPLIDVYKEVVRRK